MEKIVGLGLETSNPRNNRSLGAQFLLPPASADLLLAEPPVFYFRQPSARRLPQGQRGQLLDPAKARPALEHHAKIGLN